MNATTRKARWDVSWRANRTRFAATSLAEEQQSIAWWINAARDCARSISVAGEGVNTCGLTRDTIMRGYREAVEHRIHACRTWGVFPVPG